MSRYFHYKMSFLGHLEELRGRLIISILWFTIFTVVGGYLFHKPALELLRKPLQNIFMKNQAMLTLTVDEDGYIRMAEPMTAEQLRKLSQKMWRLQIAPDASIEIGTDNSSTLFYSNLFTPYYLIIKIALMIGLAFSIPMWLWQFWLFVGPGLRRVERGVIGPVILSSAILFPTGATFAYFVLNFGIQILMSMNYPGMEPWLDISKYLNLILNFMMIFGLMFQSPLIILLLVRIGVLKTSFLRKNRKYIMIGMLIFSAVLTPPDPWTMLGMGLPLYLLFELSILLAVIFEPRPKKDLVKTAP